MDLDSIRVIAEEFADLGSAVQEQVDDVVRGVDGRADVDEVDVNPNALRMIRKWLRIVQQECVGSEDEELRDEVDKAIQRSHELEEWLEG